MGETTDLTAATARLRELIERCETGDTGDGVMETPREGARQLAGDLRVVLAVAGGGPASGDLAVRLLSQNLDKVRVVAGLAPDIDIEDVLDAVAAGRRALAARPAPRGEEPASGDLAVHAETVAGVAAELNMFTVSAATRARLRDMLGPVETALRAAAPAPSPSGPVDGDGSADHATVNGVVLRDQTAGQLGLTARGEAR